MISKAGIFNGLLIMGFIGLLVDDICKFISTFNLRVVTKAIHFCHNVLYTYVRVLLTQSTTFMIPEGKHLHKNYYSSYVFIYTKFHRTIITGLIWGFIPMKFLMVLRLNYLPKVQLSVGSHAIHFAYLWYTTKAHIWPVDKTSHSYSYV